MLHFDFFNRSNVISLYLLLQLISDVESDSHFKNIEIA